MRILSNHSHHADAVDMKFTLQSETGRCLEVELHDSNWCVVDHSDSPLCPPAEHYAKNTGGRFFDTILWDSVG
jgi:hypothetical protein